jgi:hypothetical protein
MQHSLNFRSIKSTFPIKSALCSNRFVTYIDIIYLWNKWIDFFTNTDSLYIIDICIRFKFESFLYLFHHQIMFFHFVQKKQ